MHLDLGGVYCQTSSLWKYETGQPSSWATISGYQSLFEVTFKPSSTGEGYVGSGFTPGISIWQPAITVAWNRWDLTKFTPASAPILDKPQTWQPSTFPTAPSPWVASFSRQVAPSSTRALDAFAQDVTSPEKSGPLSVGAQAGIGLGATIAGLAVLAVLAWIVLWRRRRSSAAPRSRPVQKSHGYPNWIWLSSPVLMIGSLVAGVFLALGHHLFYASLAGTDAPTGSYRIAGSMIPKQRFNTAVGTAFAFLVRAALTVAVGIAYTQMYWRSARTARKGQKLSTMDTTYSIMTNVFEFAMVQVWVKYPLMLSLAIVAWYVLRRLGDVRH